MIKVRRPSKPPRDLDGKDSAGWKELEAVKKHYEDEVTRGTPFGHYKAYSLESVKKALNKLFNNKCAYCEMDYGGAPLDVEHFRPKGSVVEMDLMTFRAQAGAQEYAHGYYWLAADWSNLLPSCIHCNRRNKHEFEGRKDRVAGKGEFFPIAPGSPRCLDPNVDSEASEQRLLLDPCRDDPAKHLEFGEKGTVSARMTDSGTSLKGIVSIEVYGLQRDPLVRKRGALRSMLLLRINDIKQSLQELQANPADDAARGRLNSTLSEVRTHYLSPDCPFIGSSRDTLRNALFAGPMSELIPADEDFDVSRLAPLGRVPPASV